MTQSRNDSHLSKLPAPDFGAEMPGDADTFEGVLAQIRQIVKDEVSQKPKPAEIEPAEIRPAETKPDNRFVPVAVTAAPAVLVNKEAAVSDDPQQVEPEISQRSDEPNGEIRQLVTEIVRSELSGPFAAELKRNIRLMVQSEVAQALRTGK